MTTLLTLALDPTAQRRFEALRQQHYPAQRNHIPAHLSLFHKLPGTAEVAQTLRDIALSTSAFPLEVQGVRSLGRGVGYALAAPELTHLHGELARHFDRYLIPQDRQRFQPHIVVQNKATDAEAKELLASLHRSFLPSTAQATGLLWWEYLDGPGVCWRPSPSGWTSGSATVPG